MCRVFFCRTQAAVKEAEGWLGNASGLLGRARQLGPHPYVTVALMPGSSTVPAVRTPFQVCGLVAPAGFNRGSTPPPPALLVALWACL